MAKCKTLLAAFLLLSAVAAYTSAAGAGGEVMRGEDYAGPMPAGEYAKCWDGCPDSFCVCTDWCKNRGFKNGGGCVRQPPLRPQCCCKGSVSG